MTKDIYNYIDLRNELDSLRKIKFVITDEANIAWDIYQVIRYYISWQRYPQGGWTVNFDEPLSIGKEPLIVVEKIQ